jgi:hypothetical protein
MCLYQRRLFSNPGIKRDNSIVFLSSYIKEKNKFDIFNTTNRTWQVGVLPPGTHDEILELSVVCQPGDLCEGRRKTL